jgi:hypothetical protein
MVEIMNTLDGRCDWFALLIFNTEVTLADAEAKGWHRDASRRVEMDKIRLTLAHMKARMKERRADA